MLCAYFDANVFRDLFLDDGVHRSQLDRLHELVEANRWRVFGSAKQLEELSGLAGKNLGAYSLMIARGLKLVGRYFLRDRAELCRLELQKRKQLSHSEACVQGDTLSQIHALVGDRTSVSAVASQTRALHEEFQTMFARAGRAVEEQLEATGITRVTLQRDNKGHQSITKAQVDEWLLSSEVLGPELGVVRVETLSTWQLPIMRSWFAFAIAAAQKSVVDGRKPTASDGGDWDHYAYAAVGGLLVTDDRKFREIASQIELRHVRIMNSHEFFSVIAT